MNSSEIFSQKLYKKMQEVNPGIAKFELFEFRYALENFIPKDGWDSIKLDNFQVIEKKINSLDFYEGIKLRPVEFGKPVIDSQVMMITQMLFKGIVEDFYSVEWINHHFFFDLRGFFFFHRTNYHLHELQSFSNLVIYKSFDKNQNTIRTLPDVGYKVFKEANQEIDECFVQILKQVVSSHKKPILVGIAGQTAAGKTEIVSRIHEEFKRLGLTFSTLEIDHFLTDRDEREAKGIDSLGKEALHFGMFVDSLNSLKEGNLAITPQYDFIGAVSSHTSSGELKPGCVSAKVIPSDLIFIEGNFPFLYPEVAKLIDLKVMYLTDDEIRLKRKWKRDMDYRKKYDLSYFINRYFREQFLMAESVYIPQILTCDLLVDTTGATIWVNPKSPDLLTKKNEGEEEQLLKI